MKNIVLIGGSLFVIAGLIFYGFVFFGKRNNPIQSTSMKIPISQPTAVIPMVGNDKDKHGCIGSAGYSWCEIKNKCLRIWEEKCEVAKTSDLELITKALFEKNQWPSTMELTVTINKNDGTYASGSAGGSGGGGYFYAKKVGEEWKIVADGNGMITCDSLKDYPDYPKTMIPICYDSVKGENVNR